MPPSPVRPSRSPPARPGPMRWWTRPTRSLGSWTPSAPRRRARARSRRRRRAYAAATERLDDEDLPLLAMLLDGADLDDIARHLAPPIPTRSPGVRSGSSGGSAPDFASDRSGILARPRHGVTTAGRQPARCDERDADRGPYAVGGSRRRLARGASHGAPRSGATLAAAPVKRSTSSAPATRICCAISRCVPAPTSSPTPIGPWPCAQWLDDARAAGLPEHDAAASRRSTPRGIQPRGRSHCAASRTMRSSSRRRCGRARRVIWRDPNVADASPLAVAGAPDPGRGPGGARRALACRGAVRATRPAAPTSIDGLGARPSRSLTSHRSGGTWPACAGTSSMARRRARRIGRRCGSTPGSSSSGRRPPTRCTTGTVFERDGSRWRRSRLAP